MSTYQRMKLEQMATENGIASAPCDCGLVVWCTCLDADGVEHVDMRTVTDEHDLLAFMGF